MDYLSSILDLIIRIAVIRVLFTLAYQSELDELRKEGWIDVRALNTYYSITSTVGMRLFSLVVGSSIVEIPSEVQAYHITPLYSAAN